MVVAVLSSTREKEMNILLPSARKRKVNEISEPQKNDINT